MRKFVQKEEIYIKIKFLIKKINQILNQYKKKNLSLIKNRKVQKHPNKMEVNKKIKIKKVKLLNNKN